LWHDEFPGREYRRSGGTSIWVILPSAGAVCQLARFRPGPISGLDDLDHATARIESASGVRGSLDRLWFTGEAISLILRSGLCGGSAWMKSDC
jgi:hypothetical protein